MLALGVRAISDFSTATPHVDSVTIQVFPAWPKDWDVTFKLLARGRTVVHASQTAGKIRFVQLTPLLDGNCTLANPFPGSTATLYRGPEKAADLIGQSFPLQLKKGETLTLVPQGQRLP